MIAFVRGELAEVGTDAIVIDCHGIGYEILVPASVAGNLPGIGSNIQVYTYMNVREDAMQLFGFLSKESLAAFKLLITVNGVGPKVALGILSAMTADELRYAIIAEDDKALSKAPGIGAKTAKRMIIELKDKIDVAEMVTSGVSDSVAAGSMQPAGSSMEEALLALTALGYGNTEALKAIRAVPDAELMDVETLLKQALKHML